MASWLDVALPIASGGRQVTPVVTGLPAVAKSDEICTVVVKRRLHPRILREVTGEVTSDRELGSDEGAYGSL